MKTRKRRRLEGKTDYLNRKNLLKSGKPRIVFRKTNKYVIAQYVESKEAKDKIKIGMNSKILLKYGWPKQAQGSLKTIPASYFLGFLIGKKIVKEKLENPIVDFGMLRTIPKNKLFGFLKIFLVSSSVSIHLNFTPSFLKRFLINFPFCPPKKERATVSPPRIFTILATFIPLPPGSIRVSLTRFMSPNKIFSR